MGAISGSIGASAVFPINLLVNSKLVEEAYDLANEIAGSGDGNAAIWIYRYRRCSTSDCQTWGCARVVQRSHSESPKGMYVEIPANERLPHLHLSHMLSIIMSVWRLDWISSRGYIARRTRDEFRILTLIPYLRMAHFIWPTACYRWLYEINDSFLR